MNNKNKILVGCLALLLVLSVGYALFSETITINGTATAKGDFDITATCEKGYSSILVDAGVYGSADEGQSGFSEDSCIVNGISVSFETSLKQPGALRYFTVTLENTGSIDATLDIEKSTDDYGTANFVRKVCPVNEDGTTSTTCTEDLEYITNTGGTATEDIFKYSLDAIVSKDGTVCLTTDEECVMNHVTEDGVPTLRVGEKMIYKAWILWPDKYASGYDNGFVATGSFDIPFVQITN